LGKFVPKALDLKVSLKVCFRHRPKYLALLTHLDVPDRVELLNKRLDILKELLEMLNTQLANAHAARLELIVIWLIVLEIAVTVAVFALDRLLPAHLSF
jgi:uncharacterized Rmd1/YagE family protein